MRAPPRTAAPLSPLIYTERERADCRLRSAKSGRGADSPQISDVSGSRVVLQRDPYSQPSEFFEHASVSNQWNALQVLSNNDLSVVTLLCPVLPLVAVQGMVHKVY